MKKLILIVCMCMGSVAAAQEEPVGDDNPAAEGGGDQKVRYSKSTTINFEDDTIEGDLTRPDGEYIEARKKVKHSNLIRLREEFKDEIMQSVGEL